MPNGLPMKSNGFDISKQPEILTTVYNLGKEESKAKEAKIKNRLPRPNYFGFFVEKYIGSIEGAVGKAQAPVVAAAVLPALSSSKKVTNVAVMPKKQEEKKLVKQQVLSASMALMQSPPTCEKEGYGTDLNQRYSKYKDYAVSGIADSGSTWTFLAPTLDCEAQKWSLIRTDKNIVGWVKSEDLEKTTVAELREEINCSEKSDSKCKADVETESKDFVSKEPGTSQLSYLSPISSGEKADFKHRNDGSCPSTKKTPQSSVSPSPTVKGESKVSDAYTQGSCLDGYYFIPTNGTCVTQATVKNNKSSNTNYVGFLPIYGSRVTSASAEKAPPHRTEDIEKTYKKLAKKLDLFGDDLNSPYSIMIGFSKDGMKLYVKDCLDQQKTKLFACQIDIDQVNKSLDQIEKKHNPSLQDVEKTQQLFQDISQMVRMIATGNFSTKSWAATDDEIAKIDQQEAVRLLDSCMSKMKTQKLNQSVMILHDQVQEIKNLKVDEWQVNEAARYNAANLIKFCADTLDLFYNDSLSSNTEKSLCNVKSEEFQMRNMKVVSKSIVKKFYGTPNLVDSYFFESMAAMSLQPTNPKLYSSPPGMGPASAEGSYGDYCPNRTAEFIEDLLTNHPCIKKIYVPDVWLLSRLNQNQSKIVYRPFEKDDVYAVDYSEESCK